MKDKKKKKRNICPKCGSDKAYGMAIYMTVTFTCKRCGESW